MASMFPAAQRARVSTFHCMSLSLAQSIANSRIQNPEPLNQSAILGKELAQKPDSPRKILLGNKDVVTMK